MDLYQFGTLLIALGGIAYLGRRETKEQLNQMRADSTSWRIETDMKLEMWRNQTVTLLNAINQEIKDFHGRLCAIEERNKNKG